VERLEAALDRIEAAIAARDAETVRLRRIEAAASGALAELEALLAEVE